jgi:hypothetical protein
MQPTEGRNEAIVEAVKKRYGPVIDLNANPAALIEILQRFANDPLDGGSPPGGTPPEPPPPPPAPEPPPPPDPCAVFGLGPTMDDLMKEVLQLRREVSDIATRLPGEF